MKLQSASDSTFEPLLVGFAAPPQLDGPITTATWLMLPVLLDTIDPATLNGSVSAM